MSYAWNVVILISCHVNFFLHMIGYYLLFCLYKDRKHTIQRLCLIHLSLLDILKNFLFIPHLCMELEGMKNTILQQYMDICLMTVIPSLYYSLIIFITADRFLAISLNIKYRVYVTIRRGKCCLTFMWIYSMLIGIILSMLYCYGIIPKNQRTGRPDFYPYNMYIYLALDVIFIIIALGTYIFIFSRYHSGAIETHSCINQEEKKAGVLQRFRHSKFYTSAIIVCNFMLLIAIPDSVFTLYLHISKNVPPANAQYVLTLMNLFSDFIDFVIYVFIQKQVRELFLQKVLVCLKKKPKKNMLLQRELAVKRTAHKRYHYVENGQKQIGSSEV